MGAKENDVSLFLFKSKCKLTEMYINMVKTHVSLWWRYLKASLIHSCTSWGLSSTLVSRLLMSSVSLSKYLLSSCVTHTSAEDQRSCTRPSVRQEQVLVLIYSVRGVLRSSEGTRLTVTDGDRHVHRVELFIFLYGCLHLLSTRPPLPLGFTGGEGRNCQRG